MSGSDIPDLVHIQTYIFAMLANGIWGTAVGAMRRVTPARGQAIDFAGEVNEG
jgi:hypothetical protein